MSVPGPQPVSVTLESFEEPRSWVPIPKVAVGGFSGSLAVIVEWILGDVFDVVIPAPVLAAVPVVIFFIVAYLIPHRSARGDLPPLIEVTGDDTVIDADPPR